MEAHSHALAGLRQALARQQQAVTGLGDELMKQAHHLNQRIDAGRDELEQRVEFVRREALYEVRYAAAARPAPQAGMSSLPFSPAPAAVRPARILAPGRLAAQVMAGAVRLNVGCGHRPDADRLNVDMRELPGVDIVATADALPFEPSSVQEIFSSHVLEHFPREQLRRQILPGWVRLLRAGGELRAVVPDGQAMLEAWARGETGFENLRRIFYGDQEYEGDFHYDMFTPDSLRALFVEAGLVDVQIPAHARRNGDCFEFEIVGRRPDASADAA